MGKLKEGEGGGLERLYKGSKSGLCVVCIQVYTRVGVMYPMAKWVLLCIVSLG